MTTSDVVQRAHTALDGVTPGPWRLYGDDDGPLISVVSVADDRIGRWVEVARSLGDDARFIAWARTGVPELLAKVEQLRLLLAESGEAYLSAEAEVEQLRAQITAVQALHQGMWSCGDTRHTDPRIGCPECSEACMTCGEDMPCSTIRALDGEEES